MLIKCFGGPSDGQIIDIPQENDDCRIPNIIPMPYKVGDEYRFVNYILVIEENNGWTTLKFEIDTQ